MLAAPNVITVTFPGDTLAPQLAAFGDGVTGSSYWQAVTSDLTCAGTTSCIAAGTGSSAVAGAPPGSSYIDYAGGAAPAGQPANTLQPYLETLIAALPSNQQPDANSLYLFYFPTTTQITLGGAAQCVAFGGYHNTMTIAGQNVVYAVVPECTPPASSKLTVLQQATLAASHEILEAASDPIITSTGTPTGYALDETLQASYPWFGFELSELGDLCVDELGLGQDLTTEGGFTVQRMWSVANAAAGNVDPCVPSSGAVYFNAFPTVSAVIVDVGKSMTFEVDALALGAMGSWSIEVWDATGPLAGSSTTYIAFSVTGGNNGNNVGTGTVKSGDVVQVTATMLQDPSLTPGNPGWATGAVYSYNGSSAGSSTAGHMWPFMVLTHAVAQQYGITMSKSIPHHVLSQMAADARRHRRGHDLRALLRGRRGGLVSGG